MNRINHPNIIHLFEFLESGNNFYMVIQYCNGGDLEEYVGKRLNRLLPEQEAVRYLSQIRDAFVVLRENNIMHRDLKLANIFMHDGQIVVGDFGLAKAGVEMSNTNVGTPVTKAPELHKVNVGSSDAGDIQPQGRPVVHWRDILRDAVRSKPFLRL